MNEISIEEKARAYDEAIYNNYKSFNELIERLESVKNAIKEHNYGIAMDILCKPYPEFQITASTSLAESEDEMIRKVLLAYFENELEKHGNEEWDWCIHTTDVITWLEKQGEKHIDRELSNLLNRVICRVINDPNIPYSERDEVSKKIIPYVERLEKQGEQKPAENKGMNLVEEDMTPFQKKVFCIIDTAIEEEQGLKQVCDELLRLAHDEIMQKPAWSEEDEEMLNSVIHLFGIAYTRTDDINEKIAFLKSLKDRVQSQTLGSRVMSRSKELEKLVDTELANDVESSLF